MHTRQQRNIIMSLLIMTGFIIWSHLVHADPFTCDDAANTCTYRVTVTEPIKTTGGTPLLDYKQTNIKASINGGTFTLLVKPATAPTGGGIVTQDYTFATTPCKVTTLTVKASGTNLSGLEGPDTAPVTVTRDRLQDPTMCAPAAPSLVVN